MPDELNNDTALNEWNAAVAELADPAPSDEGAVISDEPTEGPTSEPAKTATAESTEQPANTQAEPVKEEPKKVNLGGLSTAELLRRVKEEPNNPDTFRALEIRLSRNDAASAGLQKTRRHGSELANQAKEVRQAIKDIETEYPDLAKPLQKLGDFAEKASQPFIEQEQKADQEAGKALIESAFPGFTSVISGQDFTGWLSTQPARVLELVNHGGPGGAIDVLNLYEQHAKQSGKPSPFELQYVASTATSVAVESAKEKADRIAAERKARLQQSSPVPSSALVARQPISDDKVSAWNAGLAELQRSERNRQ